MTNQDQIKREKKLMTILTKLERATGPDRELDLDIALAINLIRNPIERGCWSDPGECIDGDRTPGSATFVAPAYTASIDAAMTLVDLAVGTQGEGHAWFPNLWRTTTDLGRSYYWEAWLQCCGNRYEAKAENPALAICIAALLARSRGSE
jgi:hypothetical protein